jgi:hypothetical protein
VRWPGGEQRGINRTASISGRDRPNRLTGPNSIYIDSCWTVWQKAAPYEPVDVRPTRQAPGARVNACRDPKMRLMPICDQRHGKKLKDAMCVQLEQMDLIRVRLGTLFQLVRQRRINQAGRCGRVECHFAPEFCSARCSSIIRSQHQKRGF